MIDTFEKGLMTIIEEAKDRLEFYRADAKRKPREERDEFVRETMCKLIIQSLQIQDANPLNELDTRIEATLDALTDLVIIEAGQKGVQIPPPAQNLASLQKFMSQVNRTTSHFFNKQV